jgi:hypothetical protein
MATEVRKLEDMTDIKDLAALARKLNANTDALNQSLEEIQNKLNALGLGIEVWLGQSLHQSDMDDVLDEREVPTGEREYYADELGYGRHGDKWALLVRNRRTVIAPADDPRDPDVRTVFGPTDQQPLLNASRKLRIAAVDLIPALVEGLKAAAASALASIEKAKKLADTIE